MYSIFLFSMVNMLVEIPYVILGSLSFTLPFFYIVGFQNEGNAVVKFFWYWLFQFLFNLVFVYFGQFYAYFVPNEALAQVFMGLNGTVTTIFCGFMILPQDFPPFWIFMYYINPLVYALEGLNMTQFYNDNTPVTVVQGAPTVTAENFVNLFYTEFSYSHVGLDVMALFIFMFFLRVGTYVCMRYLRHEKR
jgi:ABC-type multidrug transport system permease subunit